MLRNFFMQFPWPFALDLSELENCEDNSPAVIEENDELPDNNLSFACSPEYTEIMRLLNEDKKNRIESKRLLDASKQKIKGIEEDILSTLGELSSDLEKKDERINDHSLALVCLSLSTAVFAVAFFLSAETPVVLIVLGALTVTVISISVIPWSLIKERFIGAKNT